MASVLAKGTTLISNAATEPEITSLANFLIKMGAKINGVGSATLEIEGVDELKTCDDTNIPDRIEAATYLIAAAATGGKVEISNCNPYHLMSVISILEDSGCELDVVSDTISINSDSSDNFINAVDITTSVYPGIPTDIQAQ
jgi:UDP-N-acetylglucosamine 1-carboxyvinyltransferase